MPASFRADHVGSFLRPPELLEARKNAASDPERLRQLEDAHIQRVIARQQELGFEIASDGELRRRNFMPAPFHSAAALTGARPDALFPFRPALR